MVDSSLTEARFLYCACLHSTLWCFVRPTLCIIDAEAVREVYLTDEKKTYFVDWHYRKVAPWVDFEGENFRSDA